MRRAVFIVVCAVIVGAGGAFGASCVSNDENPPPSGADASIATGDDAAIAPSEDSGTDTATSASDASDATLDAPIAPNDDSGEDASDTGAIADSGADTSAVDAAPTQIASNLGTFLYSLTASNGDLFWISQGNSTISRCVAANCAATVTTLYTDAFSLQGIAVDATNLYYTETGGGNGGTLHSIPIDSDGGVAPTYLASGLSEPLGIAVDATGLYFAQYTNAGSLNDGLVSKCDPANCLSTLTSISGQTFANSVATNATSVYWAGQGNPGTTGFVRAVPKSFDAGDVITIGFPEANATLLTLDATNVYFVAFDSSNKALVRFCPLGGCDGGADLLSTTATQVSNFGPRIATDGSHVYFLNGNGTVIEECPVTGCNGAATPHTTLDGSLNSSAIAVDATHIYVAAAGAIYQVAK